MSKVEVIAKSNTVKIQLLKSAPLQQRHGILVDVSPSKTICFEVFKSTLSILLPMAALYQGAPGQTTFLEDPPPWLKPWLRPA